MRAFPGRRIGYVLGSDLSSLNGCCDLCFLLLIGVLRWGVGRMCELCAEILIGSGRFL